MPAESNLYAAVRRYLDGLKRAGEPIEWRKVHGSATQRRGEPDLDICYGGVCVKIELKTEKGKLTKLQEHRLAQWKKALAMTAVVRSVGELKDVLRRVDTGYQAGS